MNNYGEKAIKYYGEIAKLLIDDKDIDKNSDYYQSIVNAKFNIAKAYSKLSREEKGDRINTLKKSLDMYQWIADYI